MTMPGILKTPYASRLSGMMSAAKAFKYEKPAGSAPVLQGVMRRTKPQSDHKTVSDGEKKVRGDDIMPWHKLDIISGSNFRYLTDEDGSPVLLGSGSYGDVYLAQDRKTKGLVAMKMFRRKDSSMKVVFREAAYSCVLSKLDCAPKYYGLVKNSTALHYQPLSMAVEFVGTEKRKPSDLARLVRRAEMGEDKPDLSPIQWIRVLLEVAKSLQKCHKEGIVLIDLKEDNILVRHPESDVTPLLADFGLAVHNCNWIPNFGRGRLDRPEGFWEYPHYAPELCETNEVSPAADIYSLGCIMARVGGLALGGRVPALMYLAADCTARQPCERPSSHEVIDRLKKLHKVFERRSTMESS